MFPTDLRSRLFLTLIAAVLISSILVQTAHAITIRVPGDFPRIQQAIDAARPGDEIVVNAGVYRETLVFRDKMRITLRSFDPDADPKQVTIRAFSDAPTITVRDSEEITIEGFIISSGTQINVMTLEEEAVGVGIEVIGSMDIVLNELDMVENIGRSISIDSSSATITNVDIPEPIFDEDDEINGISITNVSDVTMENVTIENNPGDGVFVENSSLNYEDGDVTGNTGIGLQGINSTISITDVSFQNHGENGVILTNSSVQFTNVAIVNNTGVGLSATSTSLTFMGGEVTGPATDGVLLDRSQAQLDNVNITNSSGVGLSATDSTANIDTSQISNHSCNGVILTGSQAQFDSLTMA